MKVSGREVAKKILEELKTQIVQKDLKPGLAIILAGNDPASEIYVDFKIKAAQEIGVVANLYKFNESQKQDCIQKIDELSNDKLVHGMIIQYPVFSSWNFDELAQRVNLKKDVDGFLPDSPYYGATALGVWEMLKTFATIEGFISVEEFLAGKKIVLIGKGRAAGKPTMRLLTSKGISHILVDSKTENPDEIIRGADLIISASGKKHIVNGSNVKDGAYVIGVGVGREEIGSEMKTFGDINEEEILPKAKLYCPTIGGIGPLTVACLLKNVIQSSHGFNG